MELNKVHHIDNREGMAALPDKCASLIISDPPYFEVKGEFDFVWKSFDEYLEFMEEQANAYKRILAENGTLYVYGDSKRIAYVQVIFDKYFGLVNSLVWEKAESGGLFGSSSSDQMRSYAKSTERILMYSNDQYNLTQCVYHIRDYIRETILNAKGQIKFKDVNTALGTATNGGGVASACLSTDKAEPTMFTAEMYGRLQEWCPELRREYEELRREYEELRREYEELRRPFNNYTESTEVLKFRFEGNDHDHDTVKPDSISTCLVMTSSRKGDLVVVPFVGSGSECVAAKKKGRDFIGFETTLKYVDMANERVRRETRQREMF